MAISHTTFSLLVFGVIIFVGIMWASIKDGE